MRRLTAFVLLVMMTIPGCAATRWVPMDAARADLLRYSTTVRVTRADSSRLILHRARIEGDSLVGWTESSDLPPGHRLRRAFPLPLDTSFHAEALQESRDETPWWVWVPLGAVGAGMIWFTATLDLPG